MADPNKLQALMQSALRTSQSRLPNATAWERAMRRAITQGHTTAYLTGLAERLNVPVNSALVSAARLSRAERAEITARVQEQLQYLKGFKDALPGLSKEQVAARANLYSGAVRATYYGARYPGLSNVPGDGSTPCKNGCKCTLVSRENGVYWVLGAAEHCSGCEARAAGSPYAG